MWPWPLGLVDACLLPLMHLALDEARVALWHHLAAYRVVIDLCRARWAVMQKACLLM